VRLTRTQERHPGVESGCRFSLRRRCWSRTASFLRVFSTHPVAQRQTATYDPKFAQQPIVKFSGSLAPENSRLSGFLAVPCDKSRMVEAEATGVDSAAHNPGAIVHPLNLTAREASRAATTSDSANSEPICFSPITGDTCGAKASIGKFRKPDLDTQKGSLETILASARHVKADPVARPMARLPNGSPAWRSTACSRDRSCES
jgi:hypothetical protein